MTTVQDILTFMEGLAPYELAESWDNVGLLCGDRAQEVTSVLCALDVTETVVQEAAERGAQLVVAHHPAIFTSVSRVTSDDTTGRVLRYAIKHDISIICMHTNADCAEGGVNDALASALFLTNVVSMEAGENGMLGRVGDLPREMQPREFALYVKECLRAGGVRFCDGGKPITRVAVGGGACGKLMDYAVASICLWWMRDTSRPKIRLRPCSPIKSQPHSRRFSPRFPSGTRTVSNLFKEEFICH